jgi:hypothetical protein
MAAMRIELELKTRYGHMAFLTSRGICLYYVGVNDLLT